MKSYSIIRALLAVSVLLLSGCLTPSGQKNDSEGLFNYTSASSQYKPIVIVSSTTIPSSGASGYITYENPNYKIKMTYPRYLKKQEDISGEIVFFLSPQNSTTDAYPANLDILVQNISSSPVSLEEFTNLSIAQLKEMVSDYNIENFEKPSL